MAVVYCTCGQRPVQWGPDLSETSRFYTISMLKNIICICLLQSILQTLTLANPQWSLSPFYRCQKRDTEIRGLIQSPPRSVESFPLASVDLDQVLSDLAKGRRESVLEPWLGLKTSWLLCSTCEIPPRTSPKHPLKLGHNPKAVLVGGSS